MLSCCLYIVSFLLQHPLVAVNLYLKFWQSWLIGCAYFSLFLWKDEALATYSAIFTDGTPHPLLKSFENGALYIYMRFPASFEELQNLSLLDHSSTHPQLPDEYSSCPVQAEQTFFNFPRLLLLPLNHFSYLIGFYDPF